MTAHAGTSSVEQENKETVRRLFAAFAAQDDAAMDELLAPGFVAHDMPPGCSPDAEGMKRSAALMHEGLQECHNTVEDMIAEGDKVVVRYTTRGVHGGDLFGVAPSGRTITLTGIEIYRLAEGRVQEFWGEYDASDLFDTP